MRGVWLGKDRAIRKFIGTSTKNLTMSEHVGFDGDALA